MDLGLHGKTALVAASSKGLGRACARSLAAEGAKVVICARTPGDLEHTANEVATETKSEVLPVVADLNLPESSDNVVQAAVERFGGLHILVTNNGGPPTGHFQSLSDDDWEYGFRLTLMSAVHLVRSALPHLIAAGWGRIINITSISAKEPLDNLLLSSVMRPAVHGLARSLANQLASKGITVNNVMPGYIRTDRVLALAREREAPLEEVLKEYASGVPLGRMGEPSEVGDVVAFLASERASYITGQSILIDGGRFKGLW